jgi:non-heme chloroperoxidase
VITTSDGVSLHVVSHGSGPAVVLVPGYGAPGRAWSWQVRALQAQHQVVTVDQRCHGRSDRPGHGHRLSRLATDLQEVLDALALTEVLLVGSSMGASTCLAYVDLFGCDRLRGLVLVDQTPKVLNEQDWELGFYGLSWDSAPTWLGTFPAGVPVPFHTPPPPEVAAVAVDGPAFSVDDTRDLLRDHTLADWRDVLPRVSVPLTAMAGRHSPFWPWESSAWMARATPHGELVVFEHSGHVPMLEEPDRFNAELLRVAGR